MSYPLLFLLVGTLIHNIPISKEYFFPIVAILSLATAIPSLSYYKTTTIFKEYAMLSISGPFAAFFWCTIASISKKSPIKKINAMIGLYILIFLPVLALAVNSFGYFTSSSSLSSIIEYSLQAIILLSILILFIAFVVSEVQRYKLMDKAGEKKNRVPVDYTYS